MLLQKWAEMTEYSNHRNSCAHPALDSVASAEKADDSFEDSLAALPSVGYRHLEPDRSESLFQNPIPSHPPRIRPTPRREVFETEENEISRVHDPQSPDCQTARRTDPAHPGHSFCQQTLLTTKSRLIQRCEHISLRCVRLPRYRVFHRAFHRFRLLPR